MFKKIAFLATISLNLLHGFDSIEKQTLREELSKIRLYQDIYFEGEVVSTNRVCDCSNRYEIMHSICSNLPRGFSVLDLGAAQGYFSFRLSHDFGAHCTLVENFEYSLKYLRKLVEINNDFGLNTNIQEQTISLRYLKNLSKTQKFDVVIATNIIHHIPGDRKEVLKAMTQLGKVVMVEIPTENFSSLLNYAEDVLHGEKLRSFFRRKENTLPTNFYLFRN